MTGLPALPWLRVGSGALLTALALLVCVAMPVHAEAGTTGGADEEEARATLARMHHAEVGTPYEGTRFVSAWTTTGTTTLLLEIKHVPGKGTVVHLVGTKARKAGMRYERRARLGARGLTGQTLRLLVRNYRLMIAATQSVAGRQAHVVEAHRRDGSLAARFWVDRATGLLLRREIHNRRGRVVRASAFIQLDMGKPARMGHSPAPAPRPWRHRLRPAELGSLRTNGWTIPRALPGGLSLVDARRGTVHGRPVVHLSYSDGLFMVSLFLQRGNLATRTLHDWHETTLKGCCDVYRQDTIPRRVTWSGDDHVYMLVADAPPHVVRGAVAALPHIDRSTTLWERMTRGFDQLGTWLNPFG